ncbi:MAG TPA: ABC transporter permease [Paludibaculum sp.]|jgi:putative ABC transport system permease protein
MGGLIDDVRGAVRRLVKSPGSSAAAVAALALGIGFSTAVYSVADVLLYRPVPIPDVDRVVMIGAREQGKVRSFRALAATDYTDWQAARPRTVQAMAVSHGRNFNLTGLGDPIQISGAAVTASFFEVMRVQPALGRFLLAEEETPGKDRAVVLGYNLWERQFGADPAVLGRTIEMSSQSYTVVGVMPKGFNFPQPIDFWVPLAMSAEAWAAPGNFYLRPVARLRDGATLEEARAEFTALAQRIAAQRPDSHKNVAVRVDLMRDRIFGDLTPSYTRLMLAAVLALLLIACLNVANLQFVRVLGRSREIAIRTALGAPRRRLVRQILTESLVLSCAGALAGLLVASWSLDVTKSYMPPEVERWLPSWSRMGLNSWVLLWTALTTVAAGLVAGVGPAWWISRAPAAEGLHESSRSATGSAARHRTRTLLVISETAIALILLIGATLMVKGFRTIGTLPLQVDPVQVLTFRLNLPQSRYRDRAAIAEFQANLLAKLQAQAGVTSAAVTSNLPRSDYSDRALITFEGRPPEQGIKNITLVQNISKDFFRTIGIPVLRGEGFTGSEGDETQPVVLVSENFARQYYSGEEPLGRRFHLGDGRWWTIRGVVADVHSDYVEPVPGPAVYLPYQQSTRGAFDVAIRTEGDANAMIPAALAAVRAIDPLQPVSLMRSFAKLISDGIVGIGYVATMLTVLGAVALFLAVLGVYSLMAYSVGERTREFGVRLALGATRSTILWMVLRGAVVIGAAGLALGLAGGYAMAQGVAQFLFGVSPFDLFTFTGMPLVLAAALAAAAILPARRATRTDPLTALRHE